MAIMVSVTYIAIVISVILVSMTLHEAVHAFVGYALGDDTARQEGRLSLNPIRHIDPFMTILLPLMLALVGGPIFGGAKPVPLDPRNLRYGEWGAAMVAIAGPLTNLLIAFAVFGIGVWCGVFTSQGVAQLGFLPQILVAGVVINLGFFVFNMLPIPPLDGSRFLYALAPDSVRRGMEVVEQYGILLVFALVLLGSSFLGKVMSMCVNAIMTAFFWIFGV